VPGNGSKTFPETGKTVTGLFLDYWNTHGGLEQEGYPITEAYNEVNDADGQTYITQYFERARFEYHPEQNDPNAKVLLGLVGREIYGSKAGNGAGGVAVPPPPWAGMKIPTPLDTAFIMPPYYGSTDPHDAQAIFVKDGKAWTRELKTGESTPEDKGIPVQTMFPGLAFTNLTAGIAWPAGDPLYGVVFLYYHNVYSMFNLATRQVIGAAPSNPLDPNSMLIPGPVYPIETYWISIDGSFRDSRDNEGLEALFILPASGANKSEGYICGSGYCQIFDATAEGHPLTERADRYPVIWPGLPFVTGIDAIVPWPNGKLYFFKGDQYAVVDLATGTADPGYPRPIN
jgi:hypothetical protein